MRILRFVYILTLNFLIVAIFGPIFLILAMAAIFQDAWQKADWETTCEKSKRRESKEAQAREEK